MEHEIFNELLLAGYEPVNLDEDVIEDNYENTDYDDMIDRMDTGYRLQGTIMDNDISPEETIPLYDPEERTPWDYNKSVSGISTGKKRFTDSRRRSYQGNLYNIFNEAMDRAIGKIPDIANYRDLLTNIASHESGFNPSIQSSSGAPAWGYFQMMEDGKKWHNIERFAGMDIQSFLNNPEEQIIAAYKLAKANESSLSENDRKRMEELGISMNGAIGGMWLGGLGGFRKFIHDNVNVSDKHWYSDGGGVDMETQIKRYN